MSEVIDILGKGALVLGFLFCIGYGLGRAHAAITYCRRRFSHADRP